LPYSRFQPFSTTDIPDEVWEDAAARWRAAQGQYDNVAPALGATSESSDGQPEGSNATQALRQAEMPHADWQALRARQLAANDQDDDGALSAGEHGAALSGGSGHDTLSSTAPAPPTSGQSIDPSRVDVFQPGADGKLHPIPGWRTTGPFGFGTWAHYFDWGGVARDLAEIGSDALLAPEAVGVVDAFAKDTAWNTGKMTANAVSKQLRRRGVVPPASEVHHAAELNGINRSQENWRNHPAFLKILPKVDHRRIHGSWGDLPRFGPLQRWWVGTPNWMKTVPAWVGAHTAEWLAQPQASDSEEGIEGPGVPPTL